MFPLEYFEDRRGNLWFRPEDVSDDDFSEMANAINSAPDDCPYVYCEDWFIDLTRLSARRWTAEQRAAFIERDQLRDKRLALRKKRK